MSAEQAIQRLREQDERPHVIWMSPQLYADLVRAMSVIGDKPMGNPMQKAARDPDASSVSQDKRPEVVPCANGCPGRMHPLQDADMLRCDRCGCKMTAEEWHSIDPGTRC